MIQIPDDDAFAERKAIMAEQWPEMAPLELARRAASQLYSTEWSRMLTAAANGNWEPAENYCRRRGEVMGRVYAEELLCEMWKIVDAAIKHEASNKRDHEAMDATGWQGKPKSRRRRR